MSHDDDDTAAEATGFDAEAEVGKLRSRITVLERELLTAIIAAILVLGAIGLWNVFQKPPQPTADDYTERELLREQVHCFGSPEEMAAARQRALAAIDRQEWERKHLTTSEPLDQFQSPTVAAGPVTEPSIVKIGDPPVTADASRSDESKCFKVVYRTRP